MMKIFGLFLLVLVLCSQVGLQLAIAAPVPVKAVGQQAEHGLDLPKQFPLSSLDEADFLGFQPAWNNAQILAGQSVLRRASRLGNRSSAVSSTRLNMAALRLEGSFKNTFIYHNSTCKGAINSVRII